MAWSLTLVALVLLGVAAVSARLSVTPVTPAMVFMVAGVVLGPRVLDGIHGGATSSAVRTLAEATLALVLFSDAARIDLGALRGGVGLPVRLLAVGLPLTIVLGTLVASGLFPELTLGEALILAIVLAPTDAALGAGRGRRRAGAPSHPTGAQRRERAQRRHLRAPPVRGRRRGRPGVGHLGRAGRGNARARGDRLRGAGRRGGGRARRRHHHRGRAARPHRPRVAPRRSGRG